jgi:hypothetical protein
MKFNLDTLLAQLRSWLPKARASLEERASELEANFTDSRRQPLPDKMHRRLYRAIETLGSPSVRRTAIRSRLDEAIAAWLDFPTAPNHLAILASPVEPIATILADTLPKQISGHGLPVRSLARFPRSNLGSQIWSNLSQELELPDRPDKSVLRSVVAIPDLSWCFVRCIDGLDAVETLLDWIARDRTHFWVIGCNEWTWHYLDRVCQLGAYWEQTLALEPLRDRELKVWLDPVAEIIEFEWSGEAEKNGDRSELEPDEEVWDSNDERRFFQQLDDVSLGLMSVAARIWVRSLVVYAPAEDDPDATETILLEPPELPNLPHLGKNERYLLFSIGLHGGASISTLAWSLGETEVAVRGQLQQLLRSGAIECKAERFYLAPTHYPRLKRDLNNNHFLV